jgi:hypothetical protein
VNGITCPGVAAVPVPETLLEFALTIPYAPPPTTMTVATTAIDLVSLLENIRRPPFIVARSGWWRAMLGRR